MVSPKKEKKIFSPKINNFFFFKRFLKKNVFDMQSKGNSYHSHETAVQKHFIPPSKVEV